MLTKARKLISFDKLESPLKRQLLREFPDGFEDAVIRIDAATSFYAVLLELEEISYLVKLNNYLVYASMEDLEDEFQESDEMPELDSDDEDE